MSTPACAQRLPMLPALSSAEILGWLQTMLLIRRTEEAMFHLYRQRTFTSHYHVYTGEEAVGVTTVAALQPHDFLFTTHRNRGHLIARGADIGLLLAEVLGRETGYNRGKAGPIHLAIPELGIPHTSGIVANSLALATGAALSCSRQGRNAVSMAFFGDGCLEEGIFTESINMAALWKLPVVYICENNSLEAVGSRGGGYSSCTTALRKLTDLPGAFGISCVTLDGVDAAAIAAAAAEAVARARRGEGPTFIEALLVRWPGSQGFFPALVPGETDINWAWDMSPIPPEFRDWYRFSDPILRLAGTLVSCGMATPTEIAILDQSARATVRAAVDFALAQPLAPPESALAGVFAP